MTFKEYLELSKKHGFFNNEVDGSLAIQDPHLTDGYDFVLLWDSLKNCFTVADIFEVNALGLIYTKMPSPRKVLHLDKCTQEEFEDMLCEFKKSLKEKIMDIKVKKMDKDFE